MNLNHILLRVDPKWHVEFRLYVTTGKASEEFVRYFEATPACQEAADAALVALFSPFAEVLRKEETKPQAQREREPVS